MGDRPWVLALDVETGGITPGAYPLCEIGAVLATPDLEPVAEFSTLLRFEPRVCQPAALAIHRLRPDHPARVRFHQGIDDFVQWCALTIGDRPCVPLAHGASFERQWLGWALTRRHGDLNDCARHQASGPVVQALDRTRWLHRLIDGKWECSQALFRALVYRVEGRDRGCTQTDLAVRAGHWTPETAQEQAHAALADARACLAGYRWMVGRLRAVWPRAGAA